jgi:RNA polymerase sigma-70 factor, ECF subfamily
VSQRRRLGGSITVETPPFHDSVATLFEKNFPRLFRYLDRLSGEPELAADLAQEAFVKLYGRGSLPEQPEAWLVTVALNLFRNVKSTRARRHRLLTIARAESAHSDPPPLPTQSAEAMELRSRVRSAIEQLSERDRRLLLLRAEGYSYRDIAMALELNEASIGTLLSRAKRAFSDVYKDESDAP